MEEYKQANKEKNIDMIKDNEQYLEINNQIDFYCNLINEIVKLNNQEIKYEDKMELVLLLKELFLLLIKNDNEDINTYFGLSKYIQLIKKLQNISNLIDSTNENKNKLLSDINYNFDFIGLDMIKKSVNLDKLFSILQKNSRVFNFFKFINSLY